MATALLLAASSTASATLETQGPDGVIAFNHDPDGTAQIYTVEVLGGEVTQLTGTSPDEGSNLGPRWSPDGSRLAFASDRDGDWDIYTMAPDGTDVVKVSDRPGDQRQPAWSPDGGRLAFLEKGAKRTGIHIVRTDGTYVKRLKTKNLDVGGGGIDWAPCKGRILFDAQRGGKGLARSYFIRPGRHLIREIAPGHDVRWNRGCKRLTFQSSAGPPESTSLYSIRWNGRDRRVVPTQWSRTYDRYHQDPAWSSNGRYLAYGFMDHSCFYCTELRVFDKKTRADETLLTANEVWFWDLDWRP